MSQSNMNSNQDSAIYRVCSNPELWVYSIFNFLPLDSIKTVGLLNRYFHSLTRIITHPSLLGLFPVTIWSNSILPLLTYHQLKNFQRVSQVAKSLTLSKSVSEVMFRDDVDPNFPDLLAETERNSRQYEDLKDRFRYGEPNPLFKFIAYRQGDSEDQVYVLNKSNVEKAKMTSLNDFDHSPSNEELVGYSKRKKELGQSDGFEIVKAFNENATSPPASELIFYQDSGSEEAIPHTIKGTGQPLWGGVLLSVTCRDVMEAFVDFFPLPSRGLYNEVAFAGIPIFGRSVDGFYITPGWYDTSLVAELSEDENEDEE